MKPGSGRRNRRTSASKSKPRIKPLPPTAAEARDEGPRLISNIVNPDAGFAAERPVTLKIEDEHGVALARFALI